MLVSPRLFQRIKGKAIRVADTLKVEALHLLALRHERAYEDFIIVTGSDHTHYKSLIQFLASLRTHERETKTIVYDLGLRKNELKNIANRFPEAELRMFPFSKYPKYFDVRVNAGEYAWKPVIVSDLLDELKCCVCWMDAGNVVHGSLNQLRKTVRSIGMYSPNSSGRIADWTHPLTLKYLKAPSALLHKRNLNGACVAFCHSNTEALILAHRWKECALKKDCIAPCGSDRSNHRQDQAVLSILAHQSGITKYMPSAKLGFKVHQDVDPVN